MGTDNERLSAAKSKNSGNGVGDGKHFRNKAEAAAYLCDLTGSLKSIAMESDLRFLAYLLDMAHIEAISVVTSIKESKNNKNA